MATCGPIRLSVAVQKVIDYYFGRTTIAPQDVSQELFKFNLTQIIVDLNSTEIADLLAKLQTPQGQLVVGRASAADQTSINALGARLASLGTDLGALNVQIQAPPPPCSQSPRWQDTGNQHPQTSFARCGEAFAQPWK